MSPSGLGHGTLTLGFFGPGVSIAATLTLTVLFYAAPTTIAAAYPGVDVALLQQAALVPTACMLVSFITNVGMVLASFLAAGVAVRHLQKVHATVLQWYMATAGVRADYAARRTRARCRGSGHGAYGDACCNCVSPPLPDAGDEHSRDGGAARGDACERHALYGAVSELEAVMDAQQGLLQFIATAIADGAGMRFLGVFRPGAASVGGLIAVMGSAAALGLRLATTVYFSK